MTGETETAGPGSADSGDAVAPILRVVRGDPAPEELAALTAVITASAGDGGGPGHPAATGRWAASTRVSRPLPRVSPGGFAASGRR